MVIRPGTLREYLEAHLPLERIERVMKTLEPFFQMVRKEEARVETTALDSFSSSPPKTATPDVRAGLVSALLQSFMKNLMFLLQPPKPNPKVEPGKKLFSLIFEWLLYECTSEDEERRDHLFGLVSQAATPA